MNIKKCRKCKEELETSFFPKMNIGRFGCGSTCLDCLKSGKKQKAIPKIWKRRKERIKNWGSEFSFFKEVAIERQVDWKVCCVECDKWIRLEDLTVWNFDHEKPKSKWEDLRLDKENLKIKCVACHFKKTNWQELKVNFSN